jgi:hypothetical protein
MLRARSKMQHRTADNMIEMIIRKRNAFYRRLLKSFCQRRIAAFQMFDGAFIPIHSIDETIILEKPVQIPAASATRIQNRVMWSIPPLHDLVDQIYIGIPQ